MYKQCYIKILAFSSKIIIRKKLYISKFWFRKIENEIILRFLVRSLQEIKVDSATDFETKQL